jgi:homoserine/homoserine lactone efflux protein
MPTQTWLAYLLAVIVISISPGPGAVASMSSGAAHGFRRGYFNVFGLQLGIVACMTIVALGLGAVIAATPMAYETIRWFGVGYLIYIGVKLWLPAKPGTVRDESGEAEMEPVSRVPSTRRGLVWRGFLINCSNPKGILFLLAVLPQFLTRDLPQTPQYVIMTLTLVAVDAVVMCVYTFLGARVLKLLQSPRQRMMIDRFFGALFFLVALGLALHRRH